MCDWVEVKIVLKREGYHLKQFFPIKVSALKGLMKFRPTFFFLFLRLYIDQRGLFFRDGLSRLLLWFIPY